MGFFNRDKDKNKKSGENHESEQDTSVKKPPPLVEMTIDSVRIAQNYNAASGSLHPTDPNPRVVILKEKKRDRYLPIWIGHAEADAIAVKLMDTYLPRPQTHDFLRSIIYGLGAVVKSVVINEFKDECIYAKTILDVDGGQMEFDCRPSDAIALAVRAGVPIFSAEEVLEKLGILLDPETGKPLTKD